MHSIIHAAKYGRKNTIMLQMSSNEPTKDQATIEKTFIETLQTAFSIK
jgi:hypothetical protein